MTSVARRHDSDYSDASQENERSATGNNVPHAESEYDSRGSDSDLSEQNPDSQESEKRVDDDEDRSNPQYIPKRGTFYEHDDRTASGGEEPASNQTSEPSAASERGGGEPEPPAERRRARKSDAVDKWSHDKFNEREQMPKSRDELVAIYGYDIRNEDAPPHARRNRRYGRGPNKYTRTWEDEEAYRRQQASAAPRKPPGAEDFPDLQSPGYQGKRRQPRQRSKSQPPSNDSSSRGSSLRRHASTKAPKDRKDKLPFKARLKASPRKPERMPDIESLTISAPVNANGNAGARRAVAQQRPVPTAQAQPQDVRLTANNAPAQVTSPAAKPSAAPAHKPQAQERARQEQGQTANAASEPRGAGASKRYSSLRQRPINDTSFHGEQRFHNEYPPTNSHPTNSQPIVQQPQQPMHQQAHRNANSTPNHPPPPHAQQQVRLGMLEPHLAAHAHPALPPHALPQRNIGQMPPQPQGYAPPAMMPAQFMQSGNSGVYGSAPMYAQAQPPYPHQIYQHHNFAQAGGVTYYAAVEQEPPPRAQRRPTAAIPIVRPKNDRPPNTAEKDNIDRIVENMFVRKPWPAHGAETKEKSQPETRSSAEPTTKEPEATPTISSEPITTEKTEEKTEEPKTPVPDIPVQSETKNPVESIPIQAETKAESNEPSVENTEVTEEKPSADA